MQTVAMVSSSAALVAEREIVQEQLVQAFDRVHLLPEDARAGTRADDFRRAAGESDFIVVLLGAESRAAVLAELEIAHQAGGHIAAFRLDYRPHRASPAEPLIEEEELIRGFGGFVRSVSGILSLRASVWSALAQYLSKSSSTYRLESEEKVYEHFNSWLTDARIGRVVLVQRTSSLILGARAGRYQEEKCVNRMKSLLSQDRPPELIHVFDPEATRDAFSNEGNYDRDKALDVLRQVVRSPSSTDDGPTGFYTSSLVGGVLARSVVVNNNVAYATSFGTGVMMSSIRESATTSDQLVYMVRDAVSRNQLSLGQLREYVMRLFGDSPF